MNWDCYAPNKIRQKNMCRRNSTCSTETFFRITSTAPFVILAAVITLNLLASDVDAKWPTHAQELLDEMDDVKILSAVQESMRDFEKTHHRHHRRKRAEKSICYDELGCFEDSGPFGYLDMLPQSPQEIATTFSFFSTENRSDRPLIEVPYLNMSEEFRKLSNDYEAGNNSDDNQSDGVDGNGTATPPRNTMTLKTFEGLDRMSVRVIVHGFGSACHHVWIYEMRTALMAVEDCIVICVDWEAGASLPNYVRAAANTRLVGKQLALMMKGLQEHKNLDLNRVHIIGFSLGAHVSGFAGSDLPGLRRITGLDPAGPLFEAQHIKARLDSTDANFVDVIHSNGENLILGGLGTWQPLGHVDFYPNGGRVQTGCSNIFVGAVTDFIWSPSAVVEGRSLCNHRRAYKFFIDSVASKCLFPAFPCNSYDDFLKGNCFPCTENDAGKDSRCGNMGYYADKSTGRGQLYLVTREEEPFCAHQFHMEIYTAESDLPLRTIGKIEAILEGDHSLNETFSITDKEDTELFAGDVISRILVPHPALGFPKSISLTYKTYSGWLSKGLPHWTISKIVLTDSYGQRYSMCRNYMLLESGNAVHIKLQPGECEISQENDITYSPFEGDVASKRLDVNAAGTTIGYTDDNDGDDVDKLREKKNVLNMGNNYKITPNKTYPMTNKVTSLPWQPVLENGNSLERNSVESSRGFQSYMPGEIFEPILKERVKPKPNVGRSFNTDDNPNVFNEQEIMEPILKATTPRSRKTKNMPIESAANTRDNSYFNVQLLPFRLGELFERAEKYARETLLPLISEQAPRFFGFGTEREEPNDRKPKYIPKIGELRNDTALGERRVIAFPPAFNETVFVVDNTPDEVDSEFVEVTNQTVNATARSSEYRESKNILSLLRVREKRTTAAPPTVIGIQQTLLAAMHQGRSMSVPASASASGPAPAISRRSYYTNPDAIRFDEDLKVVRIELPTYKPSIKSLPLSNAATSVRRLPFPYQFEIPPEPASLRSL